MADIKGSMPSEEKRFPAFVRHDVAAMEPSRIVQLWELGFGMDNVIPLWVGESDQATPAFISDAAYAALQAGKTFYTHKRGIPELRQSIADYTARLYGIPMSADRVSVTASGMHGITLICQALFEPGDNLIVVAPSWPNVVKAAQVQHAEVRFATLDPKPEGGFTLDLEKLFSLVTDRTRALFVNSPGNPTGWMIEADQQREILDFCRSRGIWLLADEVYARFVYDRAVAPSFLQLAEPDDPVIHINSFSKAWAMTGWRLGWLITPPAFGKIVDQLIEFSTSGSQAFLQHGALAALTPQGETFARSMVDRCRQGGEMVFQRLAAMERVTLSRPTASFYAFFRIDGVEDSLSFAKRILSETGVGLAPGSAFGPGGEGHMRLCYASSHNLLSKALDRLELILR